MKKAIRDYIIQRSRELFGTQGYRYTSMEGIAQSCQVSKPTLYNYFSSKQELFREVIRSLHREMDQRIMPSLEEVRGFVPRLRVLIKKSLLFTEENREMIRVLLFDAYIHFINESIQSGESPETAFQKQGCLVREHMDRQIRLLTGWLDQGVREGTVIPERDTRLMAHAILGTIREFLLLRIFNHYPDQNCDDMAREILEFITRGILKEEA